MFCLILFQMIFTVSFLLFKSLCHFFCLFLCMVWGNVLFSLIFMHLSSFPKVTCWRDGLPPHPSHYVFLPPLLKLIDCMVLEVYGFIYGSLFCCTDPYVSFSANTMLFWLLLFCSTVWSPRRLCFQICSLSSNLLWQFWVFYGSI